MMTVVKVTVVLYLIVKANQLTHLIVYNLMEAQTLINQQHSIISGSIASRPYC